MRPRTKAKPTAQLNTVKENFGRPTDDPLEAFFMKKIRDGKLQMINAESEAELQLSKFEDICPEVYAKRKLASEEDDFSKEKALWVLDWFKKKDQTRYNLLWKVFKEACAKWEYKEILSQADFPQYLFLDELDLSYVLHWALQTQIPELKNKHDFSYSELLFFALICFSSRDMISFGVIETLETIHQQILENMLGVKQQIEAHYEQSQEKQEKQAMRAQLEQEDRRFHESQQMVSVDLRKGEVFLKLPDSQEQDNITQTIKSKPIQKASKKDLRKPRGRPKSSNDKESDSKPLEPEDLKEPIRKLITYITWAYRYIYHEEVKKRKNTMNDS